MGLFGGGSQTTTTKTTRPQYIQDMINNLVPQINNAKVGDYTNMQYEGLNTDQQAALKSMLSNPEYQGAAQQLIGAGQEGLSTLDNAYNQIAQLYSEGDISTDKINKMASQLYNQSDVENAINAQNSQSERQYSTATMPEVAQQTMQQSGFGSGRALAERQAKERLVNEEQGNANTISNSAYSDAMQQAQSILTSNAANKRSALGALAQNASTQANYLNQGGALAQQNYQDQLAAVQQQTQDRQSALNNQYTNQTNAQNWGYQQINQQTNAANVLNGALGQTTKTTQPGSGSGMLGGILTTAGTVVGGIYGGPMGAALGAQLGGMAGSALSS